VNGGTKLYKDWDRHMTYYNTTNKLVTLSGTDFQMKVCNGKKT